MRQPRLLQRPPPTPGTSVGGYVLHLGDENRLAGLKAVAAALGAPYVSLVEVGCAGVHSLACGEEHDPSRPIRKTGAGSVYRGAGMRSRCCPHCLAARGVCEAEWDYPLSIFCIEHRCWLVERCQCGRWVSYRRPRLFKCACGRDLRELATEAAPDWMDAYATVFLPTPELRRASTEDGTLPLAERLAATALFEVISLVQLGSDFKKPTHAYRRSRLGVNDLAIVERLLQNWPSAFAGEVGPRLMALGRTPRSNFLTRIRRSPLPTVREQIEQIVAVGTKALLTARKRPSVEVAPAAGLVSINQVATAYGMKYSVIRAAFDEGQLERATMTIGAKGRWVSESEFQAGLWARRETMTVGEAGAYLRCDATIVRAMLQVGHLRTVRVHPAIPMERLMVRDVAALAEALSKRAARRARGDRFVRLTELKAMCSHVIRKKWVELMEKIRGREVELFHFGNPGEGLANFGVRRELALRCNARGS